MPVLGEFERFAYVSAITLGRNLPHCQPEQLKADLARLSSEQKGRIDRSLIRFRELTENTTLEKEEQKQQITMHLQPVLGWLVGSNAL